VTLISDTSASSSHEQPVVTGVLGWFTRARWRRHGRRLDETGVDELRKYLIIINRQLEEMPISSRLHKRRMELLRDRERCRTMLSSWEHRNDT
jgi:hypothetical protein